MGIPFAFWRLLKKTYLGFGLGYNSNGQLGLGDTTSRSTPVQVLTGTSFVDLSHGQYDGSAYIHSLLLKADGTCWATGKNNLGQLGNNSSGTDVSNPVSVVGGHTFTQICARGQSSLGLRNDGVVMGWGSNNYGQIGDNSTTNRSSPVAVYNVGVTFKKIVKQSSYNGAAIDTNGTLWVWGYGVAYQLGHVSNNNVSKSTPISVSLAGPIKDVCFGYQWQMVLKEDGTLWTIGSNSIGQLGINSGSASNFSTWSQVTPAKSYIAIATGCKTQYGTGYAIDTNGVLWAWGEGTSGALGQNNNTNYSSPVSVVGLTGKTFVDVVAGNLQFWAITNTGEVWACGYNGNGELGDGTVTNRSSPVSVIGGSFSRLSTGGNGLGVFLLR